MEQKDLDRVKEFIKDTFDQWKPTMIGETEPVVFMWGGANDELLMSYMPPWDSDSFVLHVVKDWDRKSDYILDMAIRANFDKNGGVVVLYKCSDNAELNFEDAHINDKANWEGAYKLDYGGTNGEAGVNKSDVLYIGWD